jgi:hypothetical protein
MPAGAQAGGTARMILAFQWNLTALSLPALVVGMFIYQTMTFSVVQHRALFSSQRALGVTRGDVDKEVRKSSPRERHALPRTDVVRGELADEAKLPDRRSTALRCRA